MHSASKEGLDIPPGMRKMAHLYDAGATFDGLRPFRVLSGNRRLPHRSFEPRSIMGKPVSCRPAQIPQRLSA